MLATLEARHEQLDDLSMQIRRMDGCAAPLSQLDNSISKVVFVNLFIESLAIC